jgi:uncharacterized membrane protein
MVELSHEFVATKLWLVVAVGTLPMTSVAAILGGGVLVPLVAVIGWFLLTPLLLLFGEEIADGLVTPPERTDRIESLKQRYTSGEIDEATFERDLERVLADDALSDADGDVAPENREGRFTVTTRSPAETRNRETASEHE